MRSPHARSGTKLTGPKYSLIDRVYLSLARHPTHLKIKVSFFRPCAKLSFIIYLWLTRDISPIGVHSSAPSNRLLSCWKALDSFTERSTGKLFGVRSSRLGLSTGWDRKKISSDNNTETDWTAERIPHFIFFSGAACVRAADTNPLWEGSGHWIPPQTGRRKKVFSLQRLETNRDFEHALSAKWFFCDASGR